MEIRNRMADVIKLRCNACQDFLEMILYDGWQQQLFDKAKNEIDTNSRYKDKYVSAYKEMRDIGVENYNVKRMDITFMSEIVHTCKAIMKPVTQKLIRAIEQLAEDRNLTNHSNENEEEEELYLRALLALCGIRKFINSVDEAEVIDDAARLKYRNIYMAKLYDLMEVIDKERIELVQKNRQIEDDIRKILTSEKPDLKWLDIYKLYLERYWIQDKDYSTYNEFVIKASDAGITNAHYMAAQVFLLLGNYQEMEKRLFLVYERSDGMDLTDTKNIIDTINQYLSKGNEMTEGMLKLVACIMEQGYQVSVTEDNFLKEHRYIIGRDTTYGYTLKKEK